MKVGEALRLLKVDDGIWRANRVATANSSTPQKPGLETVAGKLSDELAPGRLNSILKQAGPIP